MNENLKNVYLLLRKQTAPDLFSQEVSPQDVRPGDYYVAASVPKSELNRLSDIYDMFQAGGELLRAPTFGDVVTNHLHMGMLVLPKLDRMLIKGFNDYLLARVLFDLQKVPNHTQKIFA